MWALATGTQLREAESGFRYTPTTCFETFPFPQPTPQQEAAIAAAAEELNRLREGWLNPAPVDGLALSETELKKRTLTNLYNQRPTWLANAHATLDAAVFDAYGWPGQMRRLGDTRPPAGAQPPARARLRTARPRANGLRGPLVVRQAHHERQFIPLTLSGNSFRSP